MIGSRKVPHVTVQQALPSINSVASLLLACAVVGGRCACAFPRWRQLDTLLLRALRAVGLLWGTVLRVGRCASAAYWR